MRRDEQQALALAVAVTVAFFVVYALRLCPTLTLLGDSGELVTAAAVWGVPHAPGYPLFTALGHVFTWIPSHSIAWRVHLSSAVFHALTVGATMLAGFVITRSRVAAFAAGCALGLERSFLLGSLYAEVFPLNDLFCATLFLLALHLRARGGTPIPLALATGLAAAHHMMIALALPGLAVLVWRAVASYCASPRRIATLGMAFVLPLVLSYALVPLAAARDPALSWGDVHDLTSLLSLVGRSDYGGLLSAVHGSGHGTGPEREATLARFLVSGFGVVTLVVAAFGAIDLLRRRTAIGAGLLLAALISGPVFAWLNALDTGTAEGAAFFERFTTMCTVPVALAFAAGVSALATTAMSRPAKVGGALAIAGWVAFGFNRSRDVDLRRDEAGITFAHDLVLDPPDGSLVLLTGDAPADAALYVCAVEGRCGARIALSPGTLFMPWAMAEARRKHPDLAIPWSSGPALHRVHELAAGAMPENAVFVYPGLLEKDPLLAKAFTALPDHLLFRLWPPGTDARVEQEAFLRSARAMAALPLDKAPTYDVAVAHAYEAAALNHARAARDIPEARDLIPALLARSGAYGEAVREGSPSSPSTAR